MRPYKLARISAIGAMLATGILYCTNRTQAVEVTRLAEEVWDDAVPQGKEVDAIYGDWVLRNDHLIVVIADAIEGRNANMTVRNVGGSVIDLTESAKQSDQLSAYYPVGTGYQLSGPVADGEPITEKGAHAKLTFRGPALDERSRAEVVYDLADGDRWLKITTRITNTGKQPLELKRLDAIRADGEFEFGADDALGLSWAYDPYWAQAYGTLFENADMRLVTAGEGGRRSPDLLLESKEPKKLTLAAGETLELVRYLFPAADNVEVQALAQQLRGQKPLAVRLHVSDPSGDVDGAEVHVKQDGQDYGHGVTDADGKLTLHLPKGDYQAEVSAHGRGSKTLDWKVDKDQSAAIKLPAPGYVVAKITDVDGRPIACKVQFTGRDGTPSPNYGPDSAIHGVRESVLHRERFVPSAARAGRVRRDRQPWSGIRRGVQDAEGFRRQRCGARGKAQANRRHPRLAERRLS